MLVERSLKMFTSSTIRRRSSVETCHCNVQRRLPPILSSFRVFVREILTELNCPVHACYGESIAECISDRFIIALNAECSFFSRCSDLAASSDVWRI